MSANSPPSVRIRKSVWKLGNPGDDLHWYGKAVGQLRPLPLINPIGWRYQAAVHGYPRTTPDPFAIPGEPLPSTSEQKRFWEKCQHRTWFFLPWHRGYLACFEEIVAAAVVQLGGPEGWALPYWNYSDSGNPYARRLHPAFLDQFAADGSENPLWVSGRNLINPTDELDPDYVDLDCLEHSPFEGAANGGEPGFGGPVTGFSHIGSVSGRLEHLPHNLIHDDIRGLMGRLDTAALDPIFWLHHANIDRLWEVWTKRNSAFTNPIVAAWLTPPPFELHDKAGGIVRFTPDQMRDTLTVRHGYQYDDTSDPIPTHHGPIASTTMTATVGPRPEPVASSQPSIPLVGPSTTTRVSFPSHGRQPAAMTDAKSRPIRAFLNLENITGSGVHGSYTVFVNTPSAGAGAGRLLAGHLSTFGVENASVADGTHSGGGLTQVLEVTDLIAKLRQERGWDAQDLDVTLVQKRPREDRGTAADLKIGRVSLYYA
jgi:tyrosinase